MGADGRTARALIPRTAVIGLAAAAAIAACRREAPIASCDDDLRGVYASGAERWMILDRGARLEAYPLFPDGALTGELVIAPRVIDLERAVSIGSDGAAPIAGTLHQRFMRRAEQCDAQVPVRLTRCAGNALELVLA